MPLSPSSKDYLERILNSLRPQPHTPQMPITMELKDAEKKLNISVNEITDRPLRVVVMKGKKGPYYQPLWAYNGRPYVRIYDDSKDTLVDVFLLPLE